MLQIFFFGTLPQICALTQSCYGALQTNPSTSCVPFQIMSNQFNLPQTDTNQVEDDQWKQEANISKPVWVIVRIFVVVDLINFRIRL